MDEQAVARLGLKHEHQALLQDLQGYRLSPIEVQAVYERIERYLAQRELEGLAEGQMRYAAVAFGEPAGKPLAHCRLVPVKLTVDAATDVACLKPEGGGVPALRRERLFRMAFEAVEQGARLSQEDFVRLLGIDVRTVRRIVREFRQRGVFLPTRGYSQDIGRGTSHKAVAVRMYLQYATYGEMERRTSDSAASLIRYLKDFGKVVQALSMAVPQHQIAPLTGLSAHLVAEYVALYRQYDRPEHQGVLERIRHPLTPTEEKGGRR